MALTGREGGREGGMMIRDVTCRCDLGSVLSFSHISRVEAGS